MKILSVIFFAFALVGTWALAHVAKPVPEAVHEGIQTDLKRVITEYITKNRPGAINLRFDKVWTETISPKQVRAYFNYAFHESEGEVAEVTIVGSALLNKIGETPEGSTWSFDDIKVSDDEITFTEPMQVTSGNKAPVDLSTQPKTKDSN